MRGYGVTFVVQGQGKATREARMIHNPRTCNAFHSACENARDSGDDCLDLTLRELDIIAEGYVTQGMSTCTCKDGEHLHDPRMCRDCAAKFGVTYAGPVYG